MSTLDRHIGFGKETVPGTPVAPTKYIDLLGETIEETPVLEQIALSRLVALAKVANNNAAVGGGFNAQGSYQDIAHLLWYIIGGVVGTSGAGPYTHTIPNASGAAGRPYLTTEVRRDDDTRTFRYPGCLLTSLALSAAVGQSFRFDGEVAGMLPVGEGTAGTATYAALALMCALEVDVLIDAVSTNAAGWNLNIARPADAVHIMKQRGPLKPLDTGALVCDGSIEIFPDDLTEYDLFETPSEVDVQLVVTEATGLSCTINLDKCAISAGTPHVNEFDRQVMSFDFVSLFNSVATANIQAVVINDVVTVAT